MAVLALGLALTGASRFAARWLEPGHGTDWIWAEYLELAMISEPRR